MTRESLKLLDQSFIIVTVPPESTDRPYRVCLMPLGDDEKIDTDAENFLLSMTRTAEQADDYAKTLGRLLGLKAIRYAPT